MAVRLPLIVAIHLGLAVLASYLAFWLRFDGAVPPEQGELLLQTLPWLILVRGIAFLAFHLYGGLWRYTGIWDLRDIVLATGTSTVMFYAVVAWGLGLSAYPRSVLLIDSILLIFFIGGLRLTYRFLYDTRGRRRERRVLIFGAGDAGETIARELKKQSTCQPVGFVDDDPNKLGRRIHGIEVLGSRDDLAGIVASRKPHEVLVAMPGADSATMRSIVKALEPFKVPISTLPRRRDTLDRAVGLPHIRALAIEDLLPRAPVGLSAERVRTLVAGRRILVTGAGGSIGSELCRQIAALAPERLVLYERYENSLHALVSELRDHGQGAIVRPVIGDVTDANRLDEVMAESAPHIIFHAAAHKHVPLMEENPCEAVKNNVAGTVTVAGAARRWGAERFVLISTDKAVNPSSVMGATKRVAELVLQGVNGTSRTRFVTVRFGNVLGSNGSVVPRMLDQIRAGGPVTVTHPDMRRYFMLIPEAVQLVLQAALLGRQRDVFVLEMGEQLHVLEMARTLIRLSGFVPDVEIPITFVGLRPGEKLCEELAGAGELLQATGTDNILRVDSTPASRAFSMADQVIELIRVAREGRADAVIEQLRVMLPDFQPVPHLPARPAAEAVAMEMPAATPAPAEGATRAAEKDRRSLRPVLTSFGVSGQAPTR